MKRVLVIALMTIVMGRPAPPLYAQSAGDPPAADETTLPDPDQPVPYDPAEFQPWMRELRRAEIIAVGSFPIAMIVSGIGYQLGRFALTSARRGEAAMDVAPFFFSTSTEERYDDAERLGLVLSGAVISVLVATADWLIGRTDGE